MAKEVMKIKIMTPDHSLWDEFVERLEGEEGCNFREKENEEITWDCNNKPERPFATAIIKKMGGFDIKGTMKYFDDHGGHCDCEILLNIDS